MITRKLAIFNHIKDPKVSLSIKRVLDKINISTSKQSLEVTDFLDPYEQSLALAMINEFKGISFSLEGGYEKAEKRLFCFFPDFIEKDANEEVACIEIKSTDNAVLRHKDVLGTLLSLGIDRRKIGDIVIGERNFVLCKKEIANFIELNLKRINNFKVNPSKIALTNLIVSRETSKHKKVSLTSLRLDVYISQVYNLPRKDSLEYIKKGLVKVNHKPILVASYKIDEGDMVSVRGKGRTSLIAIQGTSKKGRINVDLEILI